MEQERTVYSNREDQNDAPGRHGHRRRRSA